MLRTKQIKCLSTYEMWQKIRTTTVKQSTSMNTLARASRSKSFTTLPWLPSNECFNWHGSPTTPMLRSEHTNTSPCSTFTSRIWKKLSFSNLRLSTVILKIKVQFVSARRTRRMFSTRLVSLARTVPRSSLWDKIGTLNALPSQNWARAQLTWNNTQGSSCRSQRSSKARFRIRALKRCLPS